MTSIAWNYTIASRVRTQVGPINNRMRQQQYAKPAFNGLDWPRRLKMSDVREVEVKPLDYLLTETTEAGKDFFLKDIVRHAETVSAVETALQEHDYPTHLCRQARLLYQMREHYFEDWMQLSHSETNFWKTKTHAYPCEWEVEGQHGVILGTQVAGKLLVAKNACKAALVWDYTLVDEDGEEVCHSRDLGRDFFIRYSSAQVNCHLNSGSVLLPRTGLKITFSSLVSALRFTRVKPPVEVTWQRCLAYNKKEFPQITRSARSGERCEEEHSVCIKRLSEDDARSVMYSGDAWGFYVTVSFLKCSSCIANVFYAPSDAPRSVRFHVTVGYAVREDTLISYLAGKCENVVGRHRSSKSEYVVVSKEDQSRQEGIYKPHEKPMEDIFLDLNAQFPHRINFGATLEQICDIRKMGVALLPTVQNNDWSPAWSGSVLVKP